LLEEFLDYVSDSLPDVELELDGDTLEGLEEDWL
jgi:hypothetical protein